MADRKSSKAPAFQFYPNDFLSDEHVALMSMQERGVYITLLCRCWNEGTLPADVERLAKLCGLPVASFRKLWPAVLPCFRPSGDERLANPRLEQERKKQREHRQRQSDAAVKRWHQRGSSPALPVTKPQPSQRNALQSSSSSSSSDFRPAIADARSKRPIYTSDRFSVFEWQFDELSKTLGKHFEGFDLHAFFDSLSQQSRESGLVIPRGESWSWLQAQVLSEARRRGLPIASSESVAVEARAADKRARDERIVAQLREVNRAGR